MENFDWEYYVSFYKDLSHIKTKQGALNHYIRHGINENRIYSKEKRTQKFDDFSDLCNGLLPLLEGKFPTINKKSRKKSLLIESRKCANLEFCIKNTILKLGNDWGHIIICNDSNYRFVQNICSQISENIEIFIDNSIINRDDYNNKLLSIEFLNLIDCDYILIYQTDTIIFKEFEDEFLKFDYIGALWGPSSHCDFLKRFIKKDLFFGNGGLSFRNLNLMKEALLNIEFHTKHIHINGIDDSLSKIPEDVYYSLYTLENGVFFTNDSFSIEPSEGYRLLFDESINSFGSHKPYNFLNYNKNVIIKKFIKHIGQKKLDLIKSFTKNDFNIFSNYGNCSVKISVLITLYNYEVFIDKALISVINNSFKDYEIIIVNDGSTDNSLNRIKPYLNNTNGVKIKIIDKKINTGQIHSKNIGIDYCNGDYIFMLDADNTILENCLQEHYNHIDKDTFAVYGKVKRFDEDGTFIDFVSNKPYNFETLKTGNYIDNMALYNKKKLLDLGKYNYELLRYGIGLEDYELWLRAKNHRIRFIDAHLSNYLFKKDSLNEKNYIFYPIIREYLEYVRN